jgi:isoquinoline 1-oxidoreductase beta subunit
LILGAAIPGLPAMPAFARQGVSTAALNAFVRIGTDESVTVIVNHSEMGQGTYTSIAMVVADELEADWSRIRVEPAPVDPVYNHPAFGMQATGGSTSTWVEWDRLRAMGAAAREMLISAAAAEWKVDPGACRAEKGFVIGGDKRLSFGALAEKAAKLKAPAAPKLKEPKEFRFIGKDTKRLDTPDKVNGKAVFGIDVNLKGMKVALVARAPVFGAKLKSFNADKAKAVAGVRDVIAIESGVAVVADGFWPAKLGREALEVVWDEGELAGLDSVKQGEEYAALARKPGLSARREGSDAVAAAKAVDVVYELPYLAHAPMEPLNAVADVRADGCDVYIGTQFQTLDFFAAVQITGLKPDQIKLHTPYLGGGFGRRGLFDSHVAREAILLSKAVKAPVKVIWTREDDTRGGFYRPRFLHVMKGGLDANGAAAVWNHRIVCQSFAIGTPIEGFVVKDGVDHTAVEGAADMPYDVPNIAVDWQRAPNGVPCHFWRSVGHSSNAFAVESYVDELAHAAGKDPYEFRRGLLSKNPRWKSLLEFVAEKAGWGTKLAEGRGRGIAIHESFGSLAAHVVEVSVAKNGRVKVHRIVCALDCGTVVNPDTVKAQLEGAAVFALSAALHGEITFEKGRVKQSNFTDYPLLRMDEMPAVEAHVVASGGKMGGAGEPGVPPVAPAVANAIFAATGKRLRRLPIRPEDLR